MKSFTGLFHLLIRLFRHVSSRRRYQFVLMFLLALTCSVAEVVSLGSVVPFLGILTQPEKITKLPFVESITQFFGLTSTSDLVWLMAGAFALAAVISGGMRIVLSWVSIRLANATSADLSIDMYRRTLYQPYHVHVARSSSEIISGLTQKVVTTTDVLIGFVVITTSATLFLAILVVLLYINPMVAIITIVCFGTSYAVIAFLTRSKLARNSQCIAREQTHLIKVLQEGLGAIRDVLLDGTQSVYCDVYHSAIQRLQRANGSNTYLNQAPRPAMEALGMALIAVLALVLSRRPGGVGAALPVLGALALGAQRLLPLLQQLYAHWTVVVGSQVVLSEVLNLLDQPLPENMNSDLQEPLAFHDAIKFDNVSFRYHSHGPWVLNNINLIIPKGKRVGFIGRTGSGKSTALDLLMALLEPTQGKVIIDGQVIDNAIRSAWQRLVAHVPQNIYLADSSIAANIAFGVPPEQVDMERVRQACRQAQIADFIESRPEGYNTLVGERGVRLSGGQRQRIGIARALYKQAKVLVFDEATSALDNVTEGEVMNAIESLNRELTILIIAHRMTTLQYCDTIYQIEKGRIVHQGSYDFFVSCDFKTNQLTPAAATS